MRRKLTEEELQRILATAIPDPIAGRSTHKLDATIMYEVQSRAIMRHRLALQQKLRHAEIEEDKIQELEEKLRLRYQHARVQPGESVGLTVALGLGELQSQGKLNKFHTAGGLVISKGKGRDEATRFIDMISVTRTATFIHSLIPTQPQQSRGDARRYVGHRLVSLYLWQLKAKKTDDSWWTIRTLLYDTEPERNHLIFITLDPLQLEAKGITMEMVYERLCQFDVIMGPVAYHSFAYPSAHHHAISRLELFGLPGVKSVSFDYDETEKSFVVKVEGGALKQLMNIPLFDHKKTWSNDPRSILETFGVEATRFFLLQEMKDICGSIDIGHINLLVDFMLSTGSLRPIKRSAQKKSSAYGPLSRMSFEGIFGHLVEGALRGDIDECTGISASVFLGKYGQCGTGSVGLGLDLKQL